MANITVLIKPSSSSCDLHCSYCFYKDVSKNRDVFNNGFMNINTLQNIIEKVLNENYSNINFMFQGGEPTLIGLEFYKQVVVLQDKYNLNKSNITNSIQTNGFNLNEAWVKFFKDNNFLVGVSLDGPKSVHDVYRTDYNKIGSYYEVMDFVYLLKKYDVNFNILSVITKYSANHIREIYTFYKDQGFKYLQFIPCIKNFDNNNSDENLDYYLDNESYFNFLDNLYSLWIEDLKNGSFIEIRNFMDYITVLKGNAPTSCGMGGFCSLHTVIESNGDVYPCDFYCIDEWKLGNIHENFFQDIKFNAKAKEFFDRSLFIHNECKDCKVFKLCGGGCRRNLEPFIDNIPSFNYQCSAIKSFLFKNLNSLYKLSKYL